MLRKANDHYAKRLLRTTLTNFVLGLQIASESKVHKDEIRLKADKHRHKALRARGLKAWMLFAYR